MVPSVGGRGRKEEGGGRREEEEGMALWGFVMPAPLGAGFTPPKKTHGLPSLVIVSTLT